MHYIDLHTAFHQLYLEMLLSTHEICADAARIWIKIDIEHFIKLELGNETTEYPSECSLIANAANLAGSRILRIG